MSEIVHSKFVKKREVARGKFYSRVDCRLREAASKNESFLEICSSMEGVFPTEIYSRLKFAEYELLEELVEKSHETYLKDAYQSNFSNFDNLIIDHDWRFDRNTIEAIHRLLMPYKRVLCIGTPTVFARLAESNSEHALIDWNPLLGAAIGITKNFVCKDISKCDGGEFGIEFDAVVIDPPWYPEDYDLWIRIAAKYVTRGGKLYLPIYPSLMRPSASVEVQALSKSLSQMGSVRIANIPVRYETPSFESECLRSCGLPPLHGWRSARLAEVAVDRLPDLFASEVESPYEDWTRFKFGSSTVAVKTSDRPRSSETVSPAYFFLDSVSARDGRRSKIDAINSKNVAVIAKSTLPIKKALRELLLMGDNVGENALLRACELGNGLDD